MLGAGFTPAHCNFHVFKQPFATNDLYAPTMSNTVGAGLAPAPIKSNEIDSSISFWATNSFDSSNEFWATARVAPTFILFIKFIVFPFCRIIYNVC